MTAIMIEPALTPRDEAGTARVWLQPPQQLATATTRPRILLVEDAFEMRCLLAEVLRNEGYDVTEAADGADGVGQVLESWRFRGLVDPFDLVVSDVRMPGWTGLDILEIVGARCPTTRVILITAFGTPETHAEARRLGAVALLNKPFELSILLRAVREAVSV